MGSTSLLALKGSPAETVDDSTVEELIERVKQDPDFEEKLLRSFENELERQPREPILYWIVLLLGHGESNKAVDPLLETLKNDEEYLLLESLQHALSHIGEPAYRAIMKEFKEREPDSQEKIGYYAMLEDVCESDDEQLRKETVQFLKERIRTEVNDSGSSHDAEIALHPLAAFREDGDPDFVRSMLDEIPDSPETKGIKKVLEGERKIPEID